MMNLFSGGFGIVVEVLGIVYSILHSRSLGDEDLLSIYLAVAIVDGNPSKY